jgi:hypothetical protein
VTGYSPHGALFDVGTIRNDGAAIGGISPGFLPWDITHVSSRVVVPLRRPKNYGIKSRVVIAKTYSL